ncbi:MAG: sigma-70 family RNA polymerase sigma factor [Gemmatimonadota bacterium]
MVAACSAPMIDDTVQSAWQIDHVPVAVDDESTHADIAGVPDMSDAADFNTQLRAVLPPAYGYALRLTRNRDDAEDLVQEAALLACRAAHTFEAGTNFKAWYFRILVRCFYARHRIAQRRPETVELDDTPDLQLYQNFMRSGLRSSGDDPASILLDRLGIEQVVDAIRVLPTEYGVVCSFYFMEDFTYREIADVLEVPVGTVRSRLHRGRKMLQKALWQIAQDAGVIGALTHTQEPHA